MDSLVLLLFAAQILMITVNGWTDAPNAIMSAVCSKVLDYRKAVMLAAVFNFVGVLVMSRIQTSVSDTVSGMVNLNGTPHETAVLLLCAMLTVIFYACGAWWFGIPTSESHALLAGLTGSALAFGGAEKVCMAAWVKILYGLAVSIPLGFVLGVTLTIAMQKNMAVMKKSFFDHMQVFTAAALAFAHSAQDGLKFVGMFILINSVLPVPIAMSKAAVITAAAITLGTLMGGKRIIITVGEKMTSLDKTGGLTSDIAGLICIMAATFLGLPVSTTHTKTMAVTGTGFVRNRQGINLKIMAQMVFCWLLTFPACVIIGWCLTKFMLTVRIG
ncbi:MAG: inorganic phosphate transporter [Oscillospiraceae bacterium]|nr:inorganic phosphate transporter [Oscillospiraceae bacterium]